MKRILPLILLVLLQACNNDEIESRIKRLQDSDVSTGGVAIRSELPIAYNARQAAERGISKALVKSVCAGYQVLPLSGFHVVFLKGVLGSDGYPYIELDAGDYKGTEYDKAGKIHAAGEYRSNLDMLVIPLAGNQTEHYLEEIAEHEATHRIYFMRDRVRFEATRVHRAGEVFLMPDCVPSAR